MSALTFSLIWVLSFAGMLFYITLIFSILLYILPQIKQTTLVEYSSHTKKQCQNNWDTYIFILTFALMCSVTTFVWSSPSLTTWFGHVVFASFQKKSILVVLIFFFFCLTFFSTCFYTESRVLCDFYLTCLNFCTWVVFLFTSNTLFSVIFFIEILSTLIMLLVTTSSINSNNFSYNKNNTTSSQFCILDTTTYFFSLFFFFWISLLSSLSLFLFLLFFYIKYFSFDWTLIEFVLLFFSNYSSSNHIFTLFLSWGLLIFCVFLKCGLVPFYFWKPTFFKGLSIVALFFYVFFFYFFIFLFFLSFLLLYFSEIFHALAFIFNVILFIGYFTLLSILCESFHLRLFVAVSSILNTLFIFLLFTSNHVDFFVFFL